MYEPTELNDFRSLTLDPPEKSYFSPAVFRKVTWSDYKTNGPYSVRTFANPDRGEIQSGPYVIQHPLIVNGVLHSVPRRVHLQWHSLKGEFLGLYDGLPYFLRQADWDLIWSHLEKHFDPHNFEGKPVWQYRG